MMVTPHMLAGAALGRILRRPWLAYPAAFASHLVLDIVPHLDTHGMFGRLGGPPTRMEAAVGVSDFVVGALLVGLLAARQRSRRVVLTAALLAVIIDLVEYVPPVGPWFRQWPAAAGWVHFHHAIQHNLTVAQWPLGMATQAAVMAMAMAVLRVRGTGSRAAGAQPVW